MKKKLFVLFATLVLFYSMGGIIYYSFSRPAEKPVDKISKIKEYPYILKSNATKLMQEEFKLLKENLESDNVNKDDYALSIAKLFIIDLYTINNKINKYDIGGLEYIYYDSLENYKLNVKNTLYKYVEDNQNGNRTQKLPEISSITIVSHEESTFDISKESYPSIVVKLTFAYLEELDYDKEAEITLIYKKGLYYVVEKK